MSEPFRYNREWGWCGRRPSAAPYEWARAAVVPQGWYTVGDVAEALNVSVRWARRLVRRYPVMCIRRTWHHYRYGDDQVYVRRALAVPPEVFWLVILEARQRLWRSIASLGSRAGHPVSPPSDISEEIHRLRALLARRRFVRLSGQSSTGSLGRASVGG